MTQLPWSCFKSKQTPRLMPSRPLMLRAPSLQSMPSPRKSGSATTLLAGGVVEEEAMSTTILLVGEEDGDMAQQFIIAIPMAGGEVGDMELPTTTIMVMAGVKMIRGGRGGGCL